MTTPDGLTAEALSSLKARFLIMFPSDERDWISEWVDAIEAAAVTTHVRETGCDALREAALAYRDLTVCYRTGKTPSEALFRRLAKADAALAAREEAPEDDESWRDEPLCCFSIHEFEQVCPRTGDTFHVARGCAVCPCTGYRLAPAASPVACARCGHAAHSGPLACDVGMVTTGGLCNCTRFQPATASAAAPAASPEAEGVAYVDVEDDIGPLEELLAGEVADGAGSEEGGRG